MERLDARAQEVQGAAQPATVRALSRWSAPGVKKMVAGGAGTLGGAVVAAGGAVVRVLTEGTVSDALGTMAIVVGAGAFAGGLVVVSSGYRQYVTAGRSRLPY
jgi:hypothetical protein